MKTIHIVWCHNTKANTTTARVFKSEGEARHHHGELTTQGVNAEVTSHGHHLLRLVPIHTIEEMLNSALHRHLPMLLRLRGLGGE